MSEMLDRLRRTLSERYAMEKQVGQGTAAAVYLAHDKKHDRKVAVKLLMPDLASTLSRDRFLREIQIAAKLSHPRILPLHDSGVVDGLLYYMSPEQGAGSKELDGRSDLYSLACVLYEVLAGHPPFVGSSPQEILARHALDPVPRLVAARPDVPAAVEQAVMKALAKKPGQRFASVTAFAEALSADHVPAPSAPPAGGVGRWWRALRNALRTDGGS
jgi:serine/threonine protein kinase